MKSIEARYKKAEKENTERSSYICFADAVWGKGFCKDRLYRHFNKLVETEDYELDEKRAILGFLYWLTNEPRRTKNSPKTTQNRHKTLNMVVTSHQDDAGII